MPEDDDKIYPVSEPAILDASKSGRKFIPERFRRIVGILTQFFVGQGALFGVNLLAELFLVRTLSLESYAQFGIAYGFQATVRVLMDLGFSSTIIPLVGENHEDGILVGKFVRGARHLRSRTFLGMAPFASIAFLALIHKHHWSYRSQFTLLASVLLALYSSGSISYYAAPLLLHGRLREYYLPQTSAAGVRLVAYGFLHLVNGLNAAVAAGLNALGVTVAAVMLGKKARQRIVWPLEDDPVIERKIVNFVLPAAPAIIFSAFQTQISLFLISIFGQTANIAEVAALSRIGQIFTMMMTFNIVIVEPYVARLGRVRLFAAYIKFILLACGMCILLIALAFRVPGLFVWVLGAKYESLRGVIGWAMTAGSINYIAGLLWVMNRARKWIFWSGAWMEVLLVLAMQVWFIAYWGVKTTWHAVLLMLASSFCYLAAHGYVTLLGFFKGASSSSDSIVSIDGSLLATDEPEALIMAEVAEINPPSEL